MWSTHLPQVNVAVVHLLIYKGKSDMQTITVTDNAWKKINKRLSTLESSNLRIRLNSKGCGGSSYVFEPTDKEPTGTEEYVEKDGTKIIFSGNMGFIIRGSTMDWIVKDDFSEGFDLVNPQEIGRCGCGESVILK